VVHVNHPQEIDEEVGAAFAHCRQAGITLLNQSVLLKGVNDNADVLVELSERLFATGVLPYYMHMLDKVAGAAHFEVSARKANALFKDISARLSGYLVPKLVREQPGAAAKIVLP